MAESSAHNLVHVASLADFGDKQHKIVRVEKKQIVLFKRADGVHACNNRCPHEGYPLSEGSLSEDCVLTCNWHNWKFDLASGDNLTDGDRLRTYPVEIHGQEIWLDVSEAPAAERQQTALDNLADALPRHEYDRMAREIARLEKAGGDPLDAVRQAIHWSHDRFEYGMSHAYAAAPDWLALRDEIAVDGAEKLVPVVEIAGHVAWDTLREPSFPYSGGSAAWDPEKLVDAIEREDEAAALGQIRGAYGAGLSYADLRPALARAALAHYQDFGHSAIYVVKIGQLVEHLGPAVAEPATLALVRGLVFARREDLIPEFRGYAKTLAAWDGRAGEVPTADDLVGKSVNRALAMTAAGAGDPEALYHALLGAAAKQFLIFDLSVQGRTDNQVDDNIGWLDFTHSITFANAVRQLCNEQPALWPQALLQMACFIGRNAGYLDREVDEAAWRVADISAFVTARKRALLDHSQFEYIVSCHLLKLTYAVADEIEAAPAADWAPTLAAALNRFLNSPLKRKHLIRTARQAIDFVARED